jgi:hypothetical protein
MQTTINVDLNTRVAVPSAHDPAPENVIAALIEALAAGECYEVVQSGGELFVQPISNVRVVPAPPAFSPDARAHCEAFAMAA